MRQETYLNRFVQLAQYKIGLTAKKNADYAGTEDAFKNFRLIEEVTGGRISTAAGILVRMTDKLARIANLLAKPPAVTSESLDDACNDLAVYADILFLWNTRNQKELVFPGQVAPEPTPVTVEPPPEGASPNTAEDAYEVLAKKVERGGVESLTPSERAYLEMLLKMKLGVVETQGQEAVAA